MSDIKVPAVVRLWAEDVAAEWESIAPKMRNSRDKVAEFILKLVKREREGFVETVKAVRATEEFQRAVTAAEAFTWDGPVDLEEYMARLNPVPRTGLGESTDGGRAADIPKWTDLWGIDPGFTGDLSTEEFLAKIHGRDVTHPCCRHCTDASEHHGGHDRACSRCANEVLEDSALAEVGLLDRMREETNYGCPHSEDCNCRAAVNVAADWLEGRGWLGAAVDLRMEIAPPRKEMDWLENAVFEAVGAASACWENLSGAGVFQSEKAIEVAEGLLAAIREHYEPVQGEAP